MAGSDTTPQDTRSMPRINIDAPRYDQNTYMGRAKHFFITTNPLNLLKTAADLEQAKQLVEDYRHQREPAGVTPDQIWRAKHIYDSAYHPDTGEKMFILGRMSAQVPMNMTITGCMMTFYRTTPAVVLWQWLNQSFNAVVNYTNRSGPNPISKQRLGWSYLLATSTATATALGLNRMVNKFPAIVGRYVPFAAVAAANCINIPFMRSSELSEGIPVLTDEGEEVGRSVAAAKKGITEVVVSRIVMAVPGMGISPIIMNKLEKGNLLKRYPFLNAPIQVCLVGFFLVFATPMCCALFPQKSSIKTSNLEQEIQERIKQRGKPVERVYYNKGL